MKVLGKIGYAVATPFLIVAGIILCPVALAYAVGAVFMQLGEWWRTPRSLFDEPLGLPPALDEPEPAREFRPFPARYDGWCSNCHERIYQGDPVVSVDGYYVHEECA